jgi:hypothetical protein
MKNQIHLSEGWRVQLLSTAMPDIAALTLSALDPTAEWLPTRVPAQVHEILLANGRLPDAHIGKNVEIAL